MELFARPWMLLVALPAGVGLYLAERTLLAGRAGGGPAARGARLALRSGLVIVLALAAAGPRLGREAVRPACVFALDVSRSMGDPAPVEDAYFRARGSLPAGTPRAACAFAGEARAILGFSDIEDVAAGLGLEELASGLAESRTNIAGGLRSALGLLPAGTAGAVVLISDGRETDPSETGSRAVAAALECRSRGVPVFAFVPEAADRFDLRVESFTAPSVVEAGAGVPLAVTVSGSMSARAEVVARRISVGLGRAQSSRELGRVTVRLRADAPSFVGFSDTVETPGIVRYDVLISRCNDAPLDEALTDGWPENDRAEAAVLVRGTPKVLVVEGRASRDVSSRSAAAALLGLAGSEDVERFEVVTAEPSALPASADVLAAYSAVVLEGLGRKDIPAAQEAALVGYVNGGGGLLVTGGPGAFGAGGWRDSDPLAGELPVKMTPGPLGRMLVVLIVDASGSMRMGAGSSRSVAGRTKMELAREAVAAVLPELGRDDEVALVAFRDEAELLLGPVSAAMRDQVLDSVRDLAADGPTSLVAPLEKGLEVVKSSAAQKRVAILFSDGEPTVEFSRDRLFELARGFRGEDTSLHVLGTNPSPEHRGLLNRIAAEAGGIVEHQSDYSKVKQALRALFDRATRRYVRTGPVAVGPGGALPELLEGLGDFPALGSVNRTQLKPGARSVLVAGTGEPVLALGRTGAGGAAVFTSSLGEPAFGSWEGRVRFLSQLLRELLPPPADENVTVRAVRERGELFIEIEARDDDGGPRNLLELLVEFHRPVPRTRPAAYSSGGLPDRARARQVALGRYRVRIPQTSAGRGASVPIRVLEGAGAPRQARDAALSQLSKGRGTSERELLRTHVVLPPPPELIRTGPDRASLDEIARASGGRLLGSPEEVAVALAELEPRGRREASWLLALAALGLVIAELVVRLLLRRRAARWTGRDG